MLKLWQYGVKSPEMAAPKDFAAMLPEAVNVCVSRTINSEYTLSFKIPKGTGVELRMLVEYDSQLFRITKITEADSMLSVSCEHIFIHDAKHIFLPTVAAGDCIGEDAYTVIDECMQGLSGKVYALSEAECEERGLKRIKVNIDFEAADKVTLYDVIMQVIECAGIGELYVDNYRFAIAERIGRDTKVLLSSAVNMLQCSVEADTSELVTRLYPYGRDNLEITNAKANEDKKAYIDSASYNLYGHYAACIDYGDCTDPDSLLTRALWCFDEANPDRIDVPSVSISAQVIGCDINVGDRVSVVYDEKIIGSRVVALTRYPYEETPDSVTIGKKKKDMYFYLNQVGAIARLYDGVSVKGGRLRGTAISGSIRGAGLKILSAQLTADEDGNMYINGMKIVTEE